jgi:hypothetical protein
VNTELTVLPTDQNGCGGLGSVALPDTFRPQISSELVHLVPLPHFVDEALESLGARWIKEVDIFRMLLTSRAPVEHLLQDLADRCGLSHTDIGRALCGVCDAWVAVAPNGDEEERKPVSHVIGRVVDLWVRHRDACLSPEQRRSLASNESVREGFVKGDATAKVLFDSISRLCAPTIVAGGHNSLNKSERLGYRNSIGQDPFKVFFDTLFIFDPSKADASKSTEAQFLTYLWSRLESRWKESSKRRVDDGAIRAVEGRDGEVNDITSMVADKRERSPAAPIETADEFQWTFAELCRARDEGVLQERDYDAILECCELNRGDRGAGEWAYPSSSIRMRALRGIERFKNYLRDRELEMKEPDEVRRPDEHDQEGFSAREQRKISRASLHARAERRLVRRAGHWR